MTGLTVDDLEDGDILNDAEGFKGYSQIVIIRPSLTFNPAIAPTRGNGKPIKALKTNIDPEELQARLESGRYEPHDIAAAKTLDKDGLPATGDVYIRFGDIPEGERSHDHTNDQPEAGVSVYEATVEPTADEHPGIYVPYGQKLQQILLLAHRDTYLVQGEEVGRGEDGEPLLRDVEVVCELTSPEGCGGFVPKGAVEAGR